VSEPAGPSAVTTAVVVPSSSIVDAAPSTELAGPSAEATAVVAPSSIIVDAAPSTKPAGPRAERVFVDRDFRSRETERRPVSTNRFSGRLLGSVADSERPATALLAYLSDVEDRRGKDSDEHLTHPCRDRAIDRIATDEVFADLDSHTLSALCRIASSGLRKVRHQ
jgi:hypothetical protein